MKIFITGGTGFIGSYLTSKLSDSGHEVNILSRSAKKPLSTKESINIILGDPTKEGDWQKHIPDNDVIINLAGSSIFQRWTEKTKQNIYNSRIITTRNIVEAIKKGQNKNITFINASAVGYYGMNLSDKFITEEAERGKDFLAIVAKDWEEEALNAKDYCSRIVLTRFGIVLGKEGGMLKELLPVFKFGMGSILGSGRQWISWIHQEDLFRIMLFIIENNQISGAINCTSPEPVTNNEFTKTLSKVIKRPLLVPPAPEFIIKTALGEFGNIIIKGQRVIPEKLTTAGFDFKHSTLPEALNNLLK